MRTGDAGYIKQLNRKKLLEQIITNVTQSRSDLAKTTGLNKATVSSQVNDLIKDGLVSELKQEKTAVGRRPIPLEMNEHAGYSIGIDIDHTFVNVIFVNLKGKIIHKSSLQLDDLAVDMMIDYIILHLTPLIETHNQQHPVLGLLGIGVGIHGIVNINHEIIFTPQHDWSAFNIKEKLADTFVTSVYVDNNANFSAIAEHAFHEDMTDLFCITFHSGVGLGIINNDQIYQGYQGFAGEIGHIIVQPNGKECSCGNQGCWELYASERALANKMDLSVRDSTGAFTSTLHHDAQQVLALEEYTQYIAYGLNDIINIFNPENIILNGTLFFNNPDFIDQVQHKLTSKMNNYKNIQVTKIGYDACALGGAIFSIKQYLDIDVLNYVNYNYW